MEEQALIYMRKQALIYMRKHSKDSKPFKEPEWRQSTPRVVKSFAEKYTNDVGPEVKNHERQSTPRVKKTREEMYANDVPNYLHTAPAKKSDVVKHLTPAEICASWVIELYQRIDHATEHFDRERAQILEEKSVVLYVRIAESDHRTEVEEKLAAAAAERRKNRPQEEVAA